jgi:hypothetical protein
MLIEPHFHSMKVAGMVSPLKNIWHLLHKRKGVKKRNRNEGTNVQVQDIRFHFWWGMQTYPPHEGYFYVVITSCVQKLAKNLVFYQLVLFKTACWSQSRGGKNTILFINPF